MDAAAAHEVVAWRYEPPYHIYNIPGEADEETVAFFTDPENGYWRVDDEQGKLAAFCCFGEDGRVPGGDYRTPALDIGLGIHPDRTGKGQGGMFVAAVCDFAQRSFKPPALRVTIAEWNKRAQRVWQRAGFESDGRFTAMRGQLAFVIYMKQASDA